MCVTDEWLSNAPRTYKNGSKQFYVRTSAFTPCWGCDEVDSEIGEYTKIYKPNSHGGVGEFSYRKIIRLDHAFEGHWADRAGVWATHNKLVTHLGECSDCTYRKVCNELLKIARLCIHEEEDFEDEEIEIINET